MEKRFTKDESLTNVALYWVTGTIDSSFLPYYDYANAGALTWIGEKVKEWVGSSTVPTAFAMFPADIVPAPREWAERFFNVQRWTEMPRGGHFAAMAEPDLPVRNIRGFFTLPCIVRDKCHQADLTFNSSLDRKRRNKLNRHAMPDLQTTF